MPPDAPEDLPALRALMKSPVYADRPQSPGRGDKIRTWKRIYLRELAQHGKNGQAARMAGVDPTTPNRLRRCSPLFAAACKRAIERSLLLRREAIEAEIWRSAIEGRTKPIVANGEIIGTVRVHNDRTLLRLAEAHDPKKWSPRRKLERPRNADPVMPASARASVADPKVLDAVCALAQALTSRPAIEAREVVVVEDGAPEKASQAEVGEA